MQACRILRNSVQVANVTIRTSASSLCVHSRTLTNAHGSEPRTVHEPEASATGMCVSDLLQKTASLLPRTLSAAGTAESSLFWRSILERSLTELSSSPDQVLVKATIAVAGFDKWASSRDLITALLEDPFTSDPTYSDILRNRWKNAPSYVNVEYGKPAAFAGELYSPSDWLRRFPHAIRLIELPDLSSSSTIRNESDTLLLHSDVLLLLYDPIVTSFSDLASRTRHLLNKPNTILVLTSGSDSDAHRQFVSQTLSDMGCQPGHVLFIDPQRALDAVTALQADPTSPSTIDRYQRDTLVSRISTITMVINEILTPKSPSETPLLDLRQETVLSQVHSSISASFRSIETAKEDIDCLASRIDELSAGVQKARDDTRRDVFGELAENNKTEDALSLGTKAMNTLMASLSFWRMVWRVDELAALVSAAVQARWCQGLEHQLVLQTGHLEFAQRDLSRAAFALVSAAPLRSSVLDNRLQQLTHSPSYTLTLDSLTRPIHHRRRQLIEHTTTKLHREAQSAVIGALGGVLGGAGLGWWLSVGEHILSLGAGTEMGTAIGSGALLAVGGIRWAVGKWERAKGRWAQDAARIGEGLTRDLEGTVQRTLDDKVTIVASTACKGLQDLMDRRRNEIHQLHGELRDLDTELRACARLLASRIEPSPLSVQEVNTK